MLNLFAFSALKPRDSKTSAIPAIAFTLRINNPTRKSVQVSFMLNLPLGIQPDTVRLGSPDKTIKSTNVSQCSRACIDSKQCMSWQMAKGNKTCQLFYQVPPHAWHPGFISGQKSTWTTHDSMLTLNRCGNYPQLATKVLLQAASELALHLWSVTILNKFGSNLRNITVLCQQLKHLGTVFMVLQL